MGLKTLVRKAKRGLALRILLHVTKGLAQGRFGKGPQKFWLFFEGGKTYIGFAFMVLGYGFGAAFNLGICEQCPEWDKILMTVGLVLAQVGLLDAANREDGPNAVKTDPYLRSKLGGPGVMANPPLCPHPDLTCPVCGRSGTPYLRSKLG